MRKLKTRSLAVILALFAIAACKPQPKSDAYGDILPEKEAIAKLTQVPRWCAEDTDNDGTYNIEAFSAGGDGVFSIYNSRTRSSTSDPMTWTLSKDHMTRTLPATFHPNVLSGRVRFVTKDGVQSVRLLSDDSDSIEYLSSCN